MKKSEMICIVCPIGCHLEVKTNGESKTGYSVIGAQCILGESYAIKELTNPTRIITTTVKFCGGVFRRLPVRTNTSIAKDKIFDCMKIINTVEVQAPIAMGQVIIKNILDTGVDIIASRSLE